MFARVIAGPSYLAIRQGLRSGRGDQGQPRILPPLGGDPPWRPKEALPETLPAGEPRVAKNGAMRARNAGP